MPAAPQARTRIRRIMLVGVGIIGIATAIGFAKNRPVMSAQNIDLKQYRLVFDEDFNTLDVSAVGPGSRWIAHTPWAGDFGDAQFADPTPGFPFSISDGILRIEARKGADGKWRS